MSEPDYSPGPSWRVYSQEWVVVYTSAATGAQGSAQAAVHFEDTYKDRVRPGDWRITPVSGLEPDRFPQHLWIRLWTLKSESRLKHHAVLSAARFDGSKLVQRESPEERELLGYGQKKLT